MTPELCDAVIEHRPEIIETLRANALRDAELAETERRVEQDGYVLLWATALNDAVAFCQSEADRARVPPGFVVYSRAELTTLFGDPSTAPSLSELRLIHNAKKLGGGRVLGDNPGPW